MPPSSTTQCHPLPSGAFCAFCRAFAAGLSRCSRCKMVSYCNPAHQAEHRPAHKSACNAVARTTTAMEAEAARLRNHPGDFMTRGGNLFEHSVGHFWGILETRGYMRARFAVVEALGTIAPPTRAAVQAQLDHILDMLRLCPGDNMGVRDLAPGLMLRLGHDQACFDFLKWWATTGQEGSYAWGDEPARYLNLRGEDAFERCTYLESRFVDLSHAVSMTLLKIRLLLDLRGLRSAASAMGARLPSEIVDEIRGFVPTSSIVAARRDLTHAGDPAALESRMTELERQIEVLCHTVEQANIHFWPALLDPGDELTERPGAYSHGSPEQMVLALQYTYGAWAETPGAIKHIHALHDAGQLHSNQ